MKRIGKYESLLSYVNRVDDCKFNLITTRYQRVNGELEEFEKTVESVSGQNFLNSYNAMSFMESLGGEESYIDWGDGIGQITFKSPDDNIWIVRMYHLNES